MSYFICCICVCFPGVLDCDEFGRGDEFSFGNRPGGDNEGPVLSKLGSSSTAELHPKSVAQDDPKPTAMPPASVMTRLILIMVWRKLIRNPNTYSSLIGLTWSLVSFRYENLIQTSKFRAIFFLNIQFLAALEFCRWHVEMPAIIARSIAILSDAGLGMAMFSLGMFEYKLIE